MKEQYRDAELEIILFTDPDTVAESGQENIDLGQE